MHARTALGAVVLAALATGAAHAGNPEADLVVGTFSNTGVGTVDYQGDWADSFTITVVDTANRIDIDLGGILAATGADAFSAVRVIDTGENAYTAGSSGADIDLFVLTGLDAGITTTYSYLGPTPTHQTEDSDMLALRTHAIDAMSGQNEWNGPWHVSLGDSGVLTTQLSDPQGIMSGPGVAGATSALGPFLQVREAGFSESFRIELELASVPAPGALALFGLAGAFGRRRRRA